jgi:hypothetical protein
VTSSWREMTRLIRKITLEPDVESIESVYVESAHLQNLIPCDVSVRIKFTYGVFSTLTALIYRIGE